MSQAFDPAGRAKELRARLNAAAPGLLERSDMLGSDARAVLEAARTVGNSWSGSAFGWHAEMYFGEFERPPVNARFSAEWGARMGVPPGWRSRSPEEVKEKIKQLANREGGPIAELEAKLRQDAKSIIEEIVIELAPLDSAPEFQRELEICEALGKFDWQEAASQRYCQNAANSFPTMSRDSNAVFQGRALPAHTYYEGVAWQAECLANAVRDALAKARKVLRQIELKGAVAARAGTPSSRELFLVHGNDEGAKHEVARFIEKLGLEVTILDERANRGRTLIEKFEGNADAGFAVVLLTPDDIGHAAKESTPSPRARQNVILELGYFFGRLGRARTCVLYTDGVELPSDILGLGYVPLDPHGGWKIKVLQELKAAGMEVTNDDDGLA
ncbi:MAG TPA: nucleotide-binding protein [Terriglobales bacterium]|nr:nucleotide-binding protein [Terriglobales bacterium]